MYISAQLPAEVAVTDDQKARVHTEGPDQGTFFVGHHFQLDAESTENGDLDFRDAYLKALDEFLKLEPAVAEGHAFRISIVH